MPCFLLTVSPATSEEAWQWLNRKIQENFQLSDVQDLAQRHAGADPDAFDRAKHQINTLIAAKDKYGSNTGVSVVDSSINERAGNMLSIFLDKRSEDEKIWTTALNGNPNDMKALEARSDANIRNSVKAVQDEQNRHYEDKVSWPILNAALSGISKEVSPHTESLMKKVSKLVDMARNPGSGLTPSERDAPWKCIPGKPYWDKGCFDGESPPMFEFSSGQGPRYEDLIRQQNNNPSYSQPSSSYQQTCHAVFCCPNPPC